MPELTLINHHTTEDYLCVMNDCNLNPYHFISYTIQKIEIETVIKAIIISNNRYNVVPYVELREQFYSVIVPLSLSGIVQ